MHFERIRTLLEPLTKDLGPRYSILKNKDQTEDAGKELGPRFTQTETHAHGTSIETWMFFAPYLKPEF